jgi:hypothetical protein
MTGMDANVIITYSNEGRFTLTHVEKFTLRLEVLPGSSAHHETILDGLGTPNTGGPPKPRSVITKSGIRFRFIFNTDRILQFSVSACFSQWVAGFLLLVSEIISL